jgi:transcriptional regulator with XRE-family HTH domain
MDAHDDENVIKAARELLRWTQRRLADEAKCGVATLRRYETGDRISEEIVANLFAALEGAGVMIIKKDVPVADGEVAIGVALRPWAKPEERPKAKRVYPPRKETPASASREDAEAEPRDRKRPVGGTAPTVAKPQKGARKRRKPE